MQMENGNKTKNKRMGKFIALLLTTGLIMGNFPSAVFADTSVTPDEPQTPFYIASFESLLDTSEPQTETIETEQKALNPPQTSAGLGKYT